jgi:hypothetical protein
MPCVGEVEGDHGGCEWGVPQGARDETGSDPSFEPRGGVGMPERRDGHAGCGEPGPWCGCAEGALHTGATHGGERRRTVVLIAPSGGKEPGRVTVGLPRGPQPPQGRFGQGDVTVFGALAAVDMDLEARAIDGGDLEGEGFMKPESHARDGGAGDLMVERCGRLEETLHFCHTEHGGETVGGLRAYEREGVPVAREDVWREAADATGAEAHGRGGKAIDIVAVQEGVLQRLFSDAVGGCVGELSQQADCPDRGFLRPFALATALKCGQHVLTQWGHAISPFVM